MPDSPITDRTNRDDAEKITEKALSTFTERPRVVARVVLAVLDEAGMLCQPGELEQLDHELEKARASQAQSSTVIDRLVRERNEARARATEQERLLDERAGPLAAAIRGMQQRDDEIERLQAELAKETRLRRQEQ